MTALLIPLLIEIALDALVWLHRRGRALLIGLAAGFALGALTV